MTEARAKLSTDDLTTQRVGERESGGFFLNVSRKLIVECPEEEVTRFVKEITVVRMVEVLNPGLDAEHPERVLV